MQPCAPGFTGASSETRMIQIKINFFFLSNKIFNLKQNTSDVSQMVDTRINSTALLVNTLNAHLFATVNVSINQVSYHNVNAQSV